MSGQEYDNELNQFPATSNSDDLPENSSPEDNNPDDIQDEEIRKKAEEEKRNKLKWLMIGASVLAGFIFMAVIQPRVFAKTGKEEKAYIRGHDAPVRLKAKVPERTLSPGTTATPVTVRDKKPAYIALPTKTPASHKSSRGNSSSVKSYSSSGSSYNNRSSAFAGGTNSAEEAAWKSPQTSGDRGGSSYGNIAQPVRSLPEIKSNSFKAPGEVIMGTVGLTPPELTIKMPTFIEAELLTAINSDHPGQIIAQVTRPIFDTLTGRTLLIPQGTKLVADYNSDVGFGQKRIQISWHYLLRPDGVAMELGSMQGVDPRGSGGYPARVDSHFWEQMKALGILGAFSILDTEIAYQAAAMNSPGLVELGADIQESAHTFSQEYLARVLDIKPTLTVESAKIINIITNKDICLPEYKEE